MHLRVSFRRKKINKISLLKVIKNTREGVNRYKLTLEDPKTEKNIQFVILKWMVSIKEKNYHNGH
jgi:hypothetical protein